MKQILIGDEAVDQVEDHISLRMRHRQAEFLEHVLGEVDDQLVLSRGGQQIVTEDNVYLLSGLVSPYKRVWFIDFDRAADPYNIQFNFLLGEYPTVKYVAWDDIQNNTLPGEEIPSFSAVKVFEK